jgi:hypothetical protein
MSEKPEKPGPAPGPQATAAEWSAHAQVMGKWSDWIKDHPEDADPAGEKIAGEITE